MNFLGLMFGFQGRITRAQFWLAALIWMAAAMLPFVIAGAVTAAFNLQPGYPFFIGLTAAVLIPILISIAAVGTKRLHDRNKRGWWVLLFFFAPYVLGPFLVPLLPISDSPSDMEVPGWASATLLPFVAWGIVELGVLPGTPGPNAYGEDPRIKHAALQPAN